MTTAQERFRSAISTVNEIRDICFNQVKNAAGEEENLLLDIYLPVSSAVKPRPVIFWFHGGGFRPGNDRRQIYIQIFSRAFAEKGFICIAPDYRVRSEPEQDIKGTIVDAVEDGKAAVDWFISHAHTYQADTKQMILAGGSAGGMLVANLVHHPVSPIDQQTMGIKGVISLWGPPWENVRVFSQINPHCPPTFMVHGTADTLVPYSLSQSLLNELQQAGIAARLFTIPDAPHTPISHSDEIIDQIYSFLKSDCEVG